MNKTEVEIFIEEEFLFLEKEYSFSNAVSKSINGGFEFEYSNSTTGVCITYEYKEAYLFVMLYRLVEGKLVKNPARINFDSILNGIGLDDIIMLHDPNAMVKPAYQYGNQSDFYTKKDGLRLYIRLFAENLKRFGINVLKGDFSEFRDAEKLVKARI
jgi:hypothetical protein